MKLALALCISTLTCTQALAQAPPEFSNLGPESRVVAPLGGGDTFATATAILVLPFTDIGTTCGFTDDVLAPCGGGAFGADVVYRYQPPADQCVDISLCGSIFDTVLWIVSADTTVACNNDGCGTQASRISRLSLKAGATYYVVIDGAGAACGKYYLSVTPCCDVPCAPGAVEENPEVCCQNPPIECPGGTVTDLACGPGGVDVCGTYNATSGFRDTDWYRVVVDETSLLRMEVTAESPTLIGILTAGAPLYQALCAHFSNDYCASATCAVGVAPGAYYLFVAPNDFNGIPCGTRYAIHASCTPVDVTAAADLHANDANGEPLRAGETLSVLGVVAAQWPVSTESRFTLQDDTGGIAVIGAPAWCGSISDQVAVSGVVSQVDGWTVLGPPLSVTFLRAGAPTPQPVTITTDDVNEAFENGAEPLESRLVRLYDMVIRKADGSLLAPGAAFEAATDYQLVSIKTERTAMLRILGEGNDCALASPLVGLPIPTGCALTVTGVLAQFDSSPGHRGGYRVLPRFSGDIAGNCQVRTTPLTWARLKAQYR